MIHAPGGSRFAAFLLGAALASAVWTVGVVATATSPDGARERRAAPELPPPTASVERRELEQLAWYPCDRATTSTAVPAPAVAPGSRPVVTGLAAPGVRVRTGTVLARVADEPLVAVVTDGVFYRDLVPGASGPDVAALTSAMRRANWIATASSTLGPEELDAWRRHTDLGGSVLRWRNLVAVPRDGVVGAAEVPIGDEVGVGDPVLSVVNRDSAFTCGVPDPDPAVRPSDLALEADGRRIRAGRVVVVERDGESAGSIQVTPIGHGSRTGSARLAIRSAGTQGRVLAVPLSAVRTGTGGRPLVVVVENGRASEVPVSLGVTAQGWVELVDADLAPGTTVRLFDGAGQRDEP